MQAKENALRTIKFNHPAYVMGGSPTHPVAYLGCHHEGYKGGGHFLPVGSKWTDIWGTVWHREHEGVMGFPRGNPLANTAKALSSYQWPNPNDERIVKRIYDQAKGWNKNETFLCGSHRDTLWEKSYMLVGMEEMMCRFYTEPLFAKEILHRIMDFQLGIAEHYLKIGVDMVGMGDDLGTQSGLLLSPEIVREFLLPEYSRLFAIYKKHGILIHFHSCGHIEPLLDTFMDLGVDILNPIQVTANDLDNVRRKTQGRMALAGGISSDLLVRGTPESIRSAVQRCIDQLGKDGGYFCAPDQGMPWPKENYAAYQKAVTEYGRYPLTMQPEHIEESVVTDL